MGFLWRVQCHTLQQSAQLWNLQSLNVKPHLWIKKSQLHWFGHKRLAWHVLLAKPIGKCPRGRPKTRLTHKKNPKTIKFCFHCRLKDLLNLLRVWTRAWPIGFFGPIPMFFNFHCRYPMAIPIFFITQAVSILPHGGKITTPGGILPSAKHFQTTAERHYSAHFSSGHIKKISQITIILWRKIHNCFALWGKIYTPGTILPPTEHDWLNWSHDKFGQCSVDCDICKWVSLTDK